MFQPQGELASTTWPFTPVSFETCAGQRLHHVLIIRSRKETAGNGLEQRADKLMGKPLSAMLRSDRNVTKLRSSCGKSKATSVSDFGCAVGTITLNRSNTDNRTSLRWQTAY